MLLESISDYAFQTLDAATYAFYGA